jgi:predicted DNA-binding protein YlxM (UPF0122 family)
MRSKRLSKAEWEQIRIEINGNIPMTDIAKIHKISRPALYNYAQRHGWIIIKNESKIHKARKFLARIILGK